MNAERKRRAKKVIFFDLSGTLIHKKKSAAEAFGEALEPYMARWDSEDKHALINRASKIYSHAIRQYRKKHVEIDENKRKAAIRRAIASLPLAGDESVISSINDRLVSAMNRKMRVDGKTIAVLKRLRKRYRLALISNGKESTVRAIIRRNNLGGLFPGNAVIASSALGRGKGKPHPAIFRHALTRMKVSPGEALMVGDSWRNDIEGAAKCGIDAVWINRTNKPMPRRITERNVLSVREISELPDILPE